MDIKRTAHPEGPVLFKLFVFPIIYLFASLPFFITNAIGNVIYLLLYKLLKYRVNVVRDNLKRSFPDDSEARLKESEIKYDRHLSDLF
jgi:KDO2-lipid IV(A) lauroyltransferase